MTWTRRQFGLWTTAALVMPALADEPVQQQASSRSPKGLDAVQLRAVFKERGESSVTYGLMANNLGKKGLSVSLDTRSVTGKAAKTHNLIAWLNDQHPFSRRVMVPSFVDLPGGQELQLAEIHIGAGMSNLPEKALGVVKVEVSITVGQEQRVQAFELDLGGAKRG